MSVVCAGNGPSARDARPAGEGLLVGLLLLYAALMWMWGVGRLDISDSMEASRAVGARTMMRTGDYLIPRMGSKPNLAKPPLYYWAVVGASSPGGRVTETTVRLPSALCAMAILLVLYWSVRLVLGWQTAYLAAVAAATLPMVFGAATVGEVNMMLALAVTVSLFAAFRMLESGDRASWYAVLCGAALAMGLMTKGPLVLMFFVPTVLLYVGFRRGGRLAHDWRRCLPYMIAMAFLTWLSLDAAVLAGPAGAVLYLLPVGMLLCFGLWSGGGAHWDKRWLIVLGVALLLSAIWPVLAAGRLGMEPLRQALVHQVWRARFGQVGSANRGPIWYYLLALPVAVFPFSLLVPLAFVRGYASGASSPQKRMLLLAKCWLIGSIVLFSVVSPARKVRYLLPAFPAVALLAADVMVRGARGELRGRMTRYLQGLSTLAVYVLCLAPFGLAGVWLGTGLPFSGWLPAMIVVAGAGAMLGLYLHRVRQKPWAALAALAIVLLGFKIFVHFGRSEAVNHKESSRLACLQIRSRVPQGERLYLYGRAKPAVLFYLDPQPQGFSQALRQQGRALLCIETDKTDLSSLPPGLQFTQVDRARWGRRELVLLSVQRGARPKASDLTGK